MRPIRGGRSSASPKHGDHPMPAGETVTRGEFECYACGERFEVGERVVNLPVCPRCQGEEWRPR